MACLLSVALGLLALPTAVWLLTYFGECNDIPFWIVYLEHSIHKQTTFIFAQTVSAAAAQSVDPLATHQQYRQHLVLPSLRASSPALLLVNVVSGDVSG